MARFVLEELHAATVRYLPLVCPHGAPRPADCDGCLAEAVAICDNLCRSDAYLWAQLTNAERTVEALDLLERSQFYDPAMSALLAHRAFPLMCFTSDTLLMSVTRQPSGWLASEAPRVTVDLFRQHSGPYPWKACAYTSVGWPGAQVDRVFYLRLQLDGATAKVLERGVERTIVNPFPFPPGMVLAPLARLYVYRGSNLVVG